MTCWALAVALLAVQTPASQPGARVAANLTPDTVRIGQRVTLTLAVSDVPADGEVIFPELPDTGAVTALGPPTRLPDTSPAGTWVARYELAAWRLGDLRLPAAEVQVLAGASERRITIPEITLHVASVLPAGADLDTLAWKPAADVVGGNWSTQEKLAGATLALLLLFAAATYLRWRSAALPVPVPAPRPPRERALTAITALEESGMAEAGELKALYSALSQIIRSFLAETDRRWGLDLTTMELVSAVSVDGVKPAELAALSALLGGADMAKFARWRPQVADAERALAEARRWLEAFERLPPPAPPVEVESADEVESPGAGRDEPRADDGLAEMEWIFAVDDDDADVRRREGS